MQYLQTKSTSNTEKSKYIDNSLGRSPLAQGVIFHSCVRYESIVTPAI